MLVGVFGLFFGGLNLSRSTWDRMIRAFCSAWWNATLVLFHRSCERSGGYLIPVVPSDSHFGEGGVVDENIQR